MTYQPFEIFGAERAGPWLVTCDHASNTVPPFVQSENLGLPPAEMKRHIAYDIGAAEVARTLGEQLQAPVICSNFSRLVIDPNRGLDDPTLIMQLYDGTLIPTNRHLTAAARQTRINTCYKPYHSALASLAARPNTTLVSIHSFTPQLQNRPPRPWEIGILSAQHPRLAHPPTPAQNPQLTSPTRPTEPYAGHLPGDSVDQHALRTQKPNALIEVRNDLIAHQAGQAHWAALIARHLDAARKAANL